MEAETGSWGFLAGLLCCLAAHLLSSPGHRPGVQLLLALFSGAPGIALTLGSVLLCHAPSQGQRPVSPFAFLFSDGIVPPLPPPVAAVGPNTYWYL